MSYDCVPFFVHLLRFMTHHCALSFSLALFLSLSLSSISLSRLFSFTLLSSFIIFCISVIHICSFMSIIIHHCLIHALRSIKSYTLCMHIIRTYYAHAWHRRRKTKFDFAILRSYDHGVSKCVLVLIVLIWLSLISSWLNVLQLKQHIMRSPRTSVSNCISKT